MPAAMVAGLAGSRACDGTAAVSDVRPAGRVDGAGGPVVGVEGRRTAGAAPGDRGAAQPAPEAEAGLGRPGGARRLGPAAPEVLEDGPAGNAGHAAALASAAGPLALDLPSSRRTPAGRCPGRGADRADGAGESRLGVQADPRRATRPR